MVGAVTAKACMEEVTELVRSACLRHTSIECPRFYSSCWLPNTGPLCHRCAPTRLKTEIELAKLFHRPFPGLGKWLTLQYYLNLIKCLEWSEIKSNYKVGFTVLLLLLCSILIVGLRCGSKSHRSQIIICLLFQVFHRVPKVPHLAWVLKLHCLLELCTRIQWWIFGGTSLVTRKASTVVSGTAI